MDLKKIGIILIFVLIVVGLGYLMYSMFFSSPAPRPSQEEIGVEEIEEEGIEIEGVKVPAVEEETIIPKVKVNKEETELKKIAQSFVERFGSYSNQSNYENAEDLKIFMTPKMQDWADDYVANLRQQGKDNAAYYGITSVAISGEVNQFDDKAGAVEILVTTQRREMAGTSEAKVFSQNILIVFEKIKGEWKASSATWQK